MVVLAVPPILVNAYAGVAGVDRDLVEAARAWACARARCCAGSSCRWRCRSILAGIRSAAVQVVATATLGAIFGSGGLGRFLVEGIAQNDDGMTVRRGRRSSPALALAVEGSGFVLLLRCDPIARACDGECEPAASAAER